MLPRTNKRERNKKGVIYMCWTHVWMRDGVLPLNRERLETTSTIKTWVSQMGQAAFLFSSEKLLMAPPSKCHLHCFPHWVRFNCLVLLDNPWHGTERSLSGCPFTFCKLRTPSATAWALMILALSTSLKLSSVCWSRAEDTEGVKEHGVASDTSAPREMLMPEQHKAQWGGDRPAQGIPGPVLQPLTARWCRSMCQLWATWSDSHRCQPSASNSVPWGISQCPSPGCCASGYLSMCADGSLSCSAWAQGQEASLETGASWRPQHGGWPYLPQQAKYPPSKSSHSRPQEQCKGCGFWYHFWQHWSEVWGKKSTREEG